MPEDTWKSEESHLQSHHACQPERFKLVATLCKVIGLRLKRKDETSSCSKRDHENTFIESATKSNHREVQKNSPNDHISDRGQVSMSNGQRLEQVEHETKLLVCGMLMYATVLLVGRTQNNTLC